jgi:hypothetical protein
MVVAGQSTVVPLLALVVPQVTFATLPGLQEVATVLVTVA